LGPNSDRSERLDKEVKPDCLFAQSSSKRDQAGNLSRSALPSHAGRGEKEEKSVFGLKGGPKNNIETERDTKVGGRTRIRSAVDRLSKNKAFCVNKKLLARQKDNA